MPIKTIDYDQLRMLTTKEHREIVFWGMPGEERLGHTSIEDAIEDYLEFADPMPESIEVAGFVRMKPTRFAAEDILESLIERMDEDFGDPDGDPWEPTPLVIQAADLLAAMLERDYKAWACEDVIRVRVPVCEWIEKHGPEWLKRDGDIERAQP